MRTTILGTEHAPDRPPDAKVALMVDWDNFSTRCAAQGVEVRPDELKKLGRAGGGDLVWSAIFVDTATLAPGERIKLFTTGFTIHDCPKIKIGSSGHLKDTVDPALIEQMHAVASLLPVDRVILCSEDRDYIRVVHRLRDAGKRVTVVVPSGRDRPELARHADDVLVYAQLAKVDNDVFARVARRFRENSFETKGDDECGPLLDRLAMLVRVLDEDLQVNAMRYGFLALMRKMRGALGARRIDMHESELKRLLEFLIAQDVVVTKQMKPKRGKQGRASSKSRGDSPIHYRINRTHPFEVWVQCGGAHRIVADDGPAVEQAAEAAATCVTPSGEEHPRVRRFREKYGWGGKADAREEGKADAGSEASAEEKAPASSRTRKSERRNERPTQRYAAASR